MARFFFHFRNGSEVVEDEVGVELATTEAVRAYGVEALRAILAGDVLAGVMNTASSVEVEDVNRRAVMIIRLDDVLRFDHALPNHNDIRPPFPSGIFSGNDD